MSMLRPFRQRPTASEKLPDPLAASRWPTTKAWHLVSTHLVCLVSSHLVWESHRPRDTIANEHVCADYVKHALPRVTLADSSRSESGLLTVRYKDECSIIPLAIFSRTVLSLVCTNAPSVAAEAHHADAAAWRSVQIVTFPAVQSRTFPSRTASSATRLGAPATSKWTSRAALMAAGVSVSRTGGGLGLS